MYRIHLPARRQGRRRGRIEEGARGEHEARLTKTVIVLISSMAEEDVEKVRAALTVVWRATRASMRRRGERGGERAERVLAAANIWRMDGNSVGWGWGRLDAVEMCIDDDT